MMTLERCPVSDSGVDNSLEAARAISSVGERCFHTALTPNNPLFKR